MYTVLNWLHTIGVVFWIGGLFVNNLVLTPSLQVLSPPDRGKMMGAFLKRFIPLTWGAVLIVGVTGVLLTDRLIGISALVGFDTRYGNILLVKTILVAVMIINGVYLSFVLAPKMAAFSRPPGAAGPPGPAAPGGEQPPAATPGPPSGAEAGPPPGAAPGPPPELVKLQKRMGFMGWVQSGLAVVVLLLTAM